MLNIAYNLLCGGTRLEDLGSLRNNAAYMDALGAEVVPSPTAAGDFTRRFGEGDVVGLQEAFNAVRPQLWRGRGRDLLAPVAYVDVDGTLAPTLGDKKDGMDMSYKGVWGYHPLVISLANTGEVLYLVNPAGQRREPRGSSGVDRQGHRPRGAPRRTGVRARGHGLLADGQLRPLERVCGLHLRYDSQPGMVKRAKALEAGDRERLERRPRYASRDGQDAEQAGGREGADRAGARLRQQAAQLRGRGRVRVPAGEVPQDLPDGRGAQEQSAR